MYIHHFAVKNFLSHQNTNISLSPITVLVGPNGGGKSALFDAILNFSMVARGNIRQGFGQYPYSFLATRYHGAHKLERIAFDVLMSRAEEDQEQLHYCVDYSQQGSAESGSPNFQIFSEQLSRGSHGLFDRADVQSSALGPALDYLENDRGIFAAVRAAHLDGKDEDGYPLVAECAKEISRFNRFRLNPYALAGWSRLPDTTGDSVAPPRLGYEGEDLAAALYFMQEKKDPALDVVLEKIRGVAPGFQGFEFSSPSTDRVWFSMQFQDERATVASVRISHGLLLFVGLMVLVYSPNRPPVMLIEEPENGLTPTALKEFYKSVRELAYREDPTQRSQVLISSHSPFIICEAWNGEDREFIHQVKVEDGCSVVRKFSEAIEQQGIHLQRDKSGQRTILGLRTAEELMAGYLS